MNKLDLHASHLVYETGPPLVQLVLRVPLNEDLADVPQGPGDQKVGNNLKLGALNIDLHHDLWKKWLDLIRSMPLIWYVHRLPQKTFD